MPAPTPLWGNFLARADEDLLSFAWLFSGGLHVHGYYHAAQAIEKYLKALAFAVNDPDGNTLTALNTRWVHTHDLNKLAQRCAKKFPYYGTSDTTRKLALFTEFDQVTRYPWVQQTLGNGFRSTDIPAMWDLIRHLRTDIPIRLMTICSEWSCVDIIKVGQRPPMKESIAVSNYPKPQSSECSRTWLVSFAGRILKLSPCYSPSTVRRFQG